MDASRRARPKRRRTLARDLTALTIVGVLLVGALGATGAVLYRDLYSPSAFVARYLDLLTSKQAAEALTLPGVAVDSSQLTASGLPSDANQALLRAAALAPLTNASVTDAVEGADGITTVTARYQAGPHEGTTVFRVQRAGWVGVAPTWRFATSPLAAIDLTVRGATRFTVNGFDLDTRQVAAQGADADPLDPVAASGDQDAVDAGLQRQRVGLAHRGGVSDRRIDLDDGRVGGGRPGGECSRNGLRQQVGALGRRKGLQGRQRRE